MKVKTSIVLEARWAAMWNAEKTTDETLNLSNLVNNMLKTRYEFRQRDLKKEQIEVQLANAKKEALRWNNDVTVLETELQAINNQERRKRKEELDLARREAHSFSNSMKW